MLLGIINNLPPMNILRNNQVGEIHEATLKVLEKTGVFILSQQALHILKEAGYKKGLPLISVIHFLSTLHISLANFAEFIYSTV